MQEYGPPLYAFSAGPARPRVPCRLPQTPRTPGDRAGAKSVAIYVRNEGGAAYYASNLSIHCPCQAGGKSCRGRGVRCRITLRGMLKGRWLRSRSVPKPYQVPWSVRTVIRAHLPTSRIPLRMSHGVLMECPYRDRSERVALEHASYDSRNTHKIHKSVTARCFLASRTLEMSWPYTLRLVPTFWHRFWTETSVLGGEIHSLQLLLDGPINVGLQDHRGLTRHGERLAPNTLSPLRGFASAAGPGYSTGDARNAVAFAPGAK